MGTDASQSIGMTADECGHSFLMASTLSATQEAVSSAMSKDQEKGMEG